MRRKSRKSKSEEITKRESETINNDSNTAENANHGSSSEESEPEQKKRKQEKKVSFSPKKAAKEKESEENKDENEDDDDDDRESVQYEVEAVLDEKVIQNVKHYLIRWKGYGSESDTWEPEGTLNCPDLIKRYKSKNQKDNSTKKKRDKANKHEKKIKQSHAVEDWDENEEFEVDKILEVHFKKNGKREFLVSWKGYPHAQDSWVPEDDMTCKDLIEKFMSKVEKAKEWEVKDLRVKRTHTDRFTLTTFDTGRRISKRHVGKQRVQYHDAE